MLTLLFIVCWFLMLGGFPDGLHCGWKTSGWQTVEPEEGVGGPSRPLVCGCLSEASLGRVRVAGQGQTALGAFGLAPPEPCRELLEQMLPPSLPFGPEERARTKSVHPIQVPVLACGVWETSGGSLTSACSVSQGGRETR